MPGRKLEDLDIYKPIYAFVRTIPKGSVVTYGQVAGCVSDIAVTARDVGRAMQNTPTDVPWQRVVGAGGHLPIGKRSPELKILQRKLLEAEGVSFLSDTDHRVDMSRFQWLSEAGTPDQPSLFQE